MPARSAGVLLSRMRDGEAQVLLVHPGGPFWRNKDLGAWQLPKGTVEPGEDDETAARREVAEELGIDVDGALTVLGEVRQAGGKLVVAFTIERDFDPASLLSNTVEINWPPRTGRTLTIPEIDEARWFALDDARTHMLPSQVPLLDRFVAASAQTSDLMIRPRR